MLEMPAVVSRMYMPTANFTIIEG